jgi:hypothetical protein
MPSLHDHTYITYSHIPSGGGKLTSLCTCSHVRCYAPHVFLTWSHIPSGGRMWTSLCTCSHVRCYAPHVFLTWSHIPSGVGMLTSLCTCSHVVCYASHVFLTWSHIPSGGGMLTSLCTFSHVWCYTQHLLFAWLYIPPTSFMLCSTCLFYMITFDVLPEKWEDNMEQWLMESFTGPPVEVSPKSEEYDVVTRCGSGVVVAVAGPPTRRGQWMPWWLKASEMRGLKKEPTIWWRCNLIIWECHLGIYYGIIEVLRVYHASSWHKPC